MNKVRGFEVAKGFEQKGINLPARQTKNAAGYDFEAAEYTTIPSIWKQGFKYIFNKIFSGGNEVDEKLFKPTLVATGVKSYMGTDEVLYLYNRSSNPLKKFLLLGNGVGVIDSDYYENPDNDGHIMFQFINFGILDKTIAPGDRIGQGVFAQFLKADNDTVNKERQGGFGSTN
jgi:dUTP pyrophosphatase